MLAASHESLCAPWVLRRAAGRWPFYFGCEADDRTNGWAFSPNNPFGAKLNALYSSDIGRFDVIDMRDPLAEAYELVEDGTFASAVHLWGTQDPRFFEGTAVAKAAAEELRARRRDKGGAMRGPVIR